MKNKTHTAPVNTCTALALPEKVSAKIKPPLTKKQLVEGLVETKCQQFHKINNELDDQLKAAETSARKEVARCVLSLSSELLESFVIELPQPPACGTFGVRNIESTHLDKAATGAVTAVYKIEQQINRHFQVVRDILGMKHWNSVHPADIRKAFQKQITAKLDNQSTGTVRIPDLLKKPSIKLAFENMLAQLEGAALVETVEVAA